MGRAAAPPQRSQRYRRTRFTWAAFAGLFTIGFLQAALGPALPYIRSTEHVSYLDAALLQAAFAIGGGTAGLLSAARIPPGHRALVIRTGLAGMAAAGLSLAYARHYPFTVTAAFAMSLLGTSATIRLWAALADEHHGRQTVAMTEGEVSVSTGGIIAPFTISGAAATLLQWPAAFLAGAVAAAAAILASLLVRVPAEPGRPAGHDRPPRQPGAGHRLPVTLIVVFAVVALEWSLSFWLASYLNDDVHLGRGLAVDMVSILYAANLAGRLAASRLARRVTTARLLAISLAVAFCGLPLLLAASTPLPAAAAITICGAGIGATFPLTAALHVGASPSVSTVAVGQVMATASLGQLAGPLIIGAISSPTSLRTGLITLPVLTLLAGAALTAHLCTRQVRQ